MWFLSFSVRVSGLGFRILGGFRVLGFRVGGSPILNSEVIEGRLKGVTGINVCIYIYVHIFGGVRAITTQSFVVLITQLQASCKTYRVIIGFYSEVNNTPNFQLGRRVLGFGAPKLGLRHSGTSAGSAIGNNHVRLPGVLGRYLKGPKYPNDGIWVLGLVFGGSSYQNMRHWGCWTLGVV